MRNVSISTDILVIGSGIAGLSFALRAADHAKVTVVTKKELAESNTNYAQGGIAGARGKGDSMGLHVRDTLKAGDGLCVASAVGVLAKHGPEAIRFLENLGVGFTRVRGHLSLAQEGGHSRRRIAFAGDATGKEIERALVYQCRRHKNIRLLEEHIGVDLIVRDGACVGAWVLDIAHDTLKTIRAKCVVLASGGYGRVYEHTSNPKIATGDGVAMAFRAGAVASDMEFMQFHPTALNLHGKPHYLISETVRGEGGVLLNAKKQKFMKKYHRDGDLAPRDIVSRAIVSELEKGPVYLDVRHLGEEFLKARFPSIYEQLWWYGIKMERDLIPIAPAAHYSCGGVKTDTWARTSIDRLYAFGEVASTGVHGANRLPSNSLLESVVFSKRAWDDIDHRIKSFRRSDSRAAYPFQQKAITSAQLKKTATVQKSLRSTMWRSVGIVRDGEDLMKALEKFSRILEQSQDIRATFLSAESIELENMATVAILSTLAAALREESRGGHFRCDFPNKGKLWQKHINLQSRGDSDAIEISLS